MPAKAQHSGLMSCTGPAHEHYKLRTGCECAKILRFETGYAMFDIKNLYVKHAKKGRPFLNADNPSVEMCKWHKERIELDGKSLCQLTAERTR